MDQSVVNEMAVWSVSEDEGEIPDTPIRITGLIEHVDECDIEILFSVFNFVKRAFCEFSIKRTALTPRELKRNIVKNGGICLEEKKLCEMAELYVNNMLLHEGKDRKLIKTSHTALGWKFYENEIEFDAFAIYRRNEICNSYYAGRFDIEPKGCLQNICDMFESCIKGNVAMQAIMTLGAAATVLSFSNLMWGTNTYNPIIHLMSNTSRGKTTAAKLVASFAGNPEGANSCCLSYLATSNAILKRIGSAFGMPFAIDEFSTAKNKKEWSDFIYILSNGYDKDRCAAGGSGLQKTAMFQTVFVSNGENSILKKCNANEGIRARLFEIIMDSYTRSAEEADLIKETVASNYGILTPLIAQELLKNSAKWNERRQYWKERARKKTNDENIVLNTADRITEYVALFCVASEVLGGILNDGVEVEEIFEFYYKNMIFKNAEDANIGLRVYDYVMEFIAKNRNKFYNIDEFIGIPTLDDDHIGYARDCCGDRRKHKIGDVVYNYLYIFPVDTVEELLQNKGFEDIKIAMRDLAKRKLLRTHGDRATWEFPVNGITSKVYAFWARNPMDLVCEVEKIWNE